MRARKSKYSGLMLWQKTALICVIVVAGVVCACSCALFMYSRGTMLKLAYTQAAERQRALAASFEEMANHYISVGNSPVVKRSLAKYCFACFAGDSSALVCAGETIYSSPPMPVELTARLPGGSEHTYETDIDGARHIVVGSAVRVAGDDYYVYISADLTGVYGGIYGIIRTFALVSAGGVLLGALASIYLARGSTKSLGALAGTARRIAGGEYGMRADVRAGGEVGALAEDFNFMADAVQARMAELTEIAAKQKLFIGGVTHEFKTPLTALILHSGMLRRANMTDDERDNSLEHIETQCARLERIVQTLLKLVTLDEAITTERVRVNELFERVRLSSASALNERGATLIIESGDGELDVNIDLMQSLILNLIDNAAKAYDADAEDKRVILAAREQAIEVIDYGRGIPPESLERVFEPFYMLDKSRGKKNGGVGLGLALVKRIADAHGARVSVFSAPGEGTRVRVDFGITT